MEAGISAAFAGRSRTCPIEASTIQSLPRYLEMVLALAGDSTITRNLGIAVTVESAGRACQAGTASEHALGRLPEPRPMRSWPGPRGPDKLTAAAVSRPLARRRRHHAPALLPRRPAALRRLGHARRRQLRLPRPDRDVPAPVPARGRQAGRPVRLRQRLPDRAPQRGRAARPRGRVRAARRALPRPRPGAPRRP